MKNNRILVIYSGWLGDLVWIVPVLHALKSAYASVSLVVSKTQAPLAQAYWTRLHPAEVLIDLREPIRGSNWYEPELDGSWAGPGQTSTIHMPALRKGKYDMLIDVVDAMDATIIEGMKASLAGHPLELKKEVHDRSAVLRARIDTNQLPSEHEWTLQIEFPAVISPASHGSDDTRQLAVRIKTIKFKAVN